jgi:multidrug transporter EmrE-like cation transporter
MAYMEILINANDWQLMSFFIPIIIALTQIFKTLGMDKKYYPVSNIVLGILASYFFMPSSQKDIPMAVLLGVITGLSASGLYSSGKSTIEIARNGNGK